MVFDRSPIRLPPPVLAALGAITASTLLLVHLAGQVLADHSRYIGHDYAYFFPYLVAGANWIHLHGWSPPYFTPDFCAGIPWLANPQSVFYSVPQWLATTMMPVAAMRWTLIGFATFGALGMFWLLRLCFRSSIAAATLGFVLFQLSGFLIFRMAVGHLTFHVFGLTPILALLVLWPIKSGRNELRTTLLAGVCIAAIIFGGGLALLAPIVLAVAAVIALAQSRSMAADRAWTRLAGAIVWSIPLAAIKLVPAVLLVHEYQRTELPGLIPGVGPYVGQLVRSLFLPETLEPYRTLGGISLDQHEFEYGVFAVPPLLLLAALVRWTRSARRPTRITPLIMFVVIAIVVTAFSAGSMQWAAVLHHIPIVGSTSVGTRWWVVWMIVLIVGGALAADSIATSPRWHTILMFACCGAVMLQAGLRSPARYTTAPLFSVYDPAPARAASARLAGGVPLPAISVIAKPFAERRSDGMVPWMANDGVFEGKSYIPCYEPLFGHDFKMFPTTVVAAGPVLTDVHAGPINLADPRCYLASGSSGCSPGAPFPIGDSAAARRFATHELLEWTEPWWQRMSSWSTALSLVVTMLLLAMPGLVPSRD